MEEARRKRGSCLLRRDGQGGLWRNSWWEQRAGALLCWRTGDCWWKLDLVPFPFYPYILKGPLCCPGGGADRRRPGQELREHILLNGPVALAGYLAQPICSSSRQTACSLLW